MLKDLVLEDKTFHLLLTFIIGFLLHVQLKGNLLPSRHNIKSLLLSVSSFILALSLSISFLHSLFLITGFLSSLFIHRLFISPISSFQGPFFAKLTKFWAIHHAFSGHYFQQKLQSLFNAYGEDWIRVGPNELSTRDPSAIAEIYGQREQM
jgi:hypothetical protein